MSNLKYRLGLIAALVVASIWALFPRTVVERVNRNGAIAYDTVRRVPLKRGLDLQGGMHLSLEVDESKQAVADKSDALDRALKVVRSRIDQFGVSEPVVQKAGTDRIIVELPGIDDPQRAEDVVKAQAFLQFQITDESGALEKALPRFDQIIRSRGAQVAAAGVAPAGQAPAAGLDLFTKKDSGAADTTKKDSAAAAVPGLSGTGGPMSKLINPGSIPGEYIVAAADEPTLASYLALPEIQAAMPPGREILWGADTVSQGAAPFRTLYMVESRPIITGEYLEDAKPNQSPTDGTIVEFRFNNEGGRKFRSETGKHVQDYMAIVLDDKVMGTPPVIIQAIGARGQITMGQGRPLQAAQDLALVLRAGSLPVPLKVAEVRSIGASLGADSIAKGTTAMLIAVGLVIAIMIGYYRFSGTLAVGALILFVLFTLAVLAGFDAVLTLPGLAGLVLSVGIAVDANVLIFERIREELDRGKTVRTAIDEGFKHAWSAILDTSVATVLTAAVLYQYGTGPVRGFAVTLIAGIAASLFCAVFVTKTLYLVWLSRAKTAQTLSI